MPESDKNLPENSQENLERKLDHAVEETFPTSDPVSVTITKGGAIDYDKQGNATSGISAGLNQQGQGTAEGLVQQATETVSSVVGTASETPREDYNQGRRYVRQAAEQYPKAERLYREGTRAVREYAPENPLLYLLLGVGIGYVLAWMIHDDDRMRDHVPDYARTRQNRTS